MEIGKVKRPFSQTAHRYATKSFQKPRPGGQVGDKKLVGLIRASLRLIDYFRKTKTPELKASSIRGLKYFERSTTPLLTEKNGNALAKYVIVRRSKLMSPVAVTI